MLPSLLLTGKVATENRKTWSSPVPEPGAGTCGGQTGASTSQAPPGAPGAPVNTGTGAGAGAVMPNTPSLPGPYSRVFGAGDMNTPSAVTSSMLLGR